MSNGMILSCTPNEKDFALIRPHKDSKPGDVLYIEGSSPPVKKFENISSNKFTKAVANLVSNEEYYATFGGMKLRTQAGLIETKPYNNCSIS